MRQTILGLMAAVACASSHAGLTGFAQLRQAQRPGSLADCSRVAACSTLAREAQLELLHEQRFGSRFNTTVRLDAVHDDAVRARDVDVREAFFDWAATPALDLKAGRQVITWGVSDYLYVNDIFPKNYDSFFTGGSFDRMKEPVDALKALARTGSVDVEVVLARSKADTLPAAERFTATAATSGALEDDNGRRPDLAAKVAAQWAGWDVAAHAARFRSREPRLSMTGAGLRFDQPRTDHLGVSATGNLAAGLGWVEAAVRRVSTGQPGTVVDRQFLGSAARMIAGYSREVGPDLTASAQLQVEGTTDRGRYAASLAPGVRPLRRLTSIVHLRALGRWRNQTLGAGLQAFLGSEGDSHFNPFLAWSPADGWSLEGGANLFRGQPDTRYGAFRDDSNVYVLGRYSF
jgi:hypothetical protein